MKAFHTLLTSLYPVLPPPGASPLPPSQVLSQWNVPSGACGSGSGQALTIWGAFLEDQGFDLDHNSMIWSSVNTSHFDRTQRIFRTDRDVRNWFPLQCSDQRHVDNVHGVVTDSDARTRFLSASYIAEELERVDRHDYLGIPWLLTADRANFSSELAATISYEKKSIEGRVVIKHPDGSPMDLSSLLAAQDAAGIASRYVNYMDQIRLPNSAGKNRTACCLLRVPAGKIAANYYLIEFFHAFSKVPTDELITRIIQTTEIAACAIQSVLAPTIMQEAENSRLRVFLSDVIAHDIHNWLTSVDSSLEIISNTLKQSKMPSEFRRLAEEALVLAQFENAICPVFMPGFSRVYSNRDGGDMEDIKLTSIVEWIGGLRHPSLRESKIAVDLDWDPKGITVPGKIRVVLANLVRNAVKANQDRPNAEIRVCISISMAVLRFSVASEGAFDLADWEGRQSPTECPSQHRGLWLCREMLKSVGSMLTQESHPRFGCVLCFTLDVS